ncbi:MAG: ABC transporter ATP-binding protein [Pirellulaceae bacterium]|jgi:putative ABC transport system ATP-binding protein|nr:ABC transporter ATP-binding protein [Pirellulaceae bacterium]
MSIAAASNPVLDVRDVHKAYRRGGADTRVLSGIDLQVHGGECVFLVGPSGSGKSTLLSILGCILTPDRGTLRIVGRDVGQIDERARVRLRRDVIGFVFQRFQLIRGLSVLDNVLVPMRLQGKPPSAARQRALELIQSVGLGECAHALPQQLSAGQCQRVAFARALANDPLILLADEPTASLDIATGDEIMQLLRRLIQQYHKTAIVVTHDARIFRYADRILRLDGGQLQDQGGRT